MRASISAFVKNFGRSAGAFFSTFFAGALLATFFAGTFLAGTFFAGALATIFFAGVFAAGFFAATFFTAFFATGFAADFLLLLPFAAWLLEGTLFLTGWFFLFLRFRTEPDTHIVLRAGYSALKKPFWLRNYRP